jgi:large subunit ribosomal protein L10
MRRAQKVDLIGTIEHDLGRATVAVLAEYRGLTAGEMNRLRRAVREVDGRCRVSKNTLTKRAVSTSRYEKMTPMLRGPLALILGFRDPVVIAKLAVKFAEELPKLEIKGAVLDGQVLPAAEVKALAALPSREVLLAQLLGLLQAPASRLLRTINEPAAQLARLVDQIGKVRGASAHGEPAGSGTEEGAAS